MVAEKIPLDAIDRFQKQSIDRGRLSKMNWRASVNRLAAASTPPLKGEGTINQPDAEPKEALEPWPTYREFSEAIHFDIRKAV
jgi:hypothetical protein